MTKAFFDTNVIVYANDARDAAKHRRAIECVSSALRNGTAVISTQVLAEYAVTALEKLHQSAEVVQRQVFLLEAMELVQVTPGLIRRAIELHQLHQVHFWDAGIIAAAELANCQLIYSEDFAAGRLYGSVRVENPLADD
jgi:predicted nucleic acid-binding protein